MIEVIEIGNVIQIPSCIEYAVIICQDKIINTDNLPEDIKISAKEYKDTAYKTDDSLKSIVYDVEKLSIINELKKANDNRTHAMEKLGMSRRTFYRKLRLFNIDSDMYVK